MSGYMNDALVVDANVHLRSSAQRNPAVTWPDDWPPGNRLRGVDYFDAMQGAGVHRAVLVTGIRVDGFDNGPTLAAAASAPGTFVPVGNLDITAANASQTLQELKSKGSAGIRFYGGREPFADAWIGSSMAEATLKLAAHLGLSVSFETTNAASLPRLASLAEKTLGVTFVVNAAASLTGAEPDLAGILAPLVPRRNVVVVMLPQQLENRALVEALTRSIGPERLMWGSYSMYRGARLPDTAHSLADLVSRVSEVFDFLDSSERGAILGGNACRIYSELSAEKAPL